MMCQVAGGYGSIIISKLRYLEIVFCRADKIVFYKSKKCLAVRLIIAY